MMTEQELKNKLASISNEELAEMADKQLSKLCETGGRSFRMTVPVRYDDSDIILGELIKRFNSVIIENELSQLDIFNLPEDQKRRFAREIKEIKKRLSKIEKDYQKDPSKDGRSRPPRPRSRPETSID